jgi:hypothetical protein
LWNKSKKFKLADQDKLADKASKVYQADNILKKKRIKLRRLTL